MGGITYWTMVDSNKILQDMLDELSDCSQTTPDLFIDLEGENLSRTGTLSILQILLYSKPHVYLVDCLKLGAEAFETRNSKGTNLKEILESDKIKKAIFDVRNDSAALYHQYGISLAGMEDIQLMEVATRNRRRQYLSGLSKCIEFDVSLGPRERRHCIELKEQGKRLFEPASGGSYSVFQERPLQEDILRYCVQDVCILPVVWNTYSRKMRSATRQMVLSETTRRIQETKSPNFNGKGQHMARAPPALMTVTNYGFAGQISGEDCLDDGSVKRCLNVMLEMKNEGTKKSKDQEDADNEPNEVQDLIAKLSSQKLK